MPEISTPSLTVRNVEAFDCETHLIAPGMLAPPMVCTSFAALNGGPELLSGAHDARRIVERIEAACFDDDSILVGANTAFDVCVLMAWNEVLVAPLLYAYECSRVYDVQENERLADIAKGQLGGTVNHRGEFSRREYSLAALAKRHLGHDRSFEKQDPNGWRLRYRELDGVPIHAWPVEAARYAQDDADDTLGVFLAQLPDSSWLPHAAHRARTALSLHMLSCHGIMTDPAAIDALENATAGRFADLTLEMVREGLVRANGVRDTKKAKARIVAVYRNHGIPVPLTDTGVKLVTSTVKAHAEEHGQANDREAIASLIEAATDLVAEEYASLDEEACTESCDPVLMRYAERTRLQTIVNTHIPDLRKGVTTPIQARWGLAETGRVTCSKGKGGSQNGFQLTNPAKAVRLLCGACGGHGWIDTADTLPGNGPQEGCDVCEGEGEVEGPGIRECFIARPGHLIADADFSGLELCTVAQACHVLVGWSDLGAALNAGIDVHLDFGAQMLGITYDEAKARKHEKQVKDARFLAKAFNFGMPGGMGARGFLAYLRAMGVKHLSLEDVKRFKDLWLARWTEFPHYFRYIRDLCGEEGVAFVEQLYSGRRRGLVPYTAACNTYFQGLGADGATAALWDVTALCYGDPSSVLYGCRPVNFVHDQILLEIPEERAHECAVELGRVMVEACNRYLPDVPVRCEPALSKAWHKGAEAVFEEGRLVAWDIAKAERRAGLVYADGKPVIW